MDRKSARYIYLGLLIGAVLGLLIGSMSDNIILGIWMGAIHGGFIGWFAAAAMHQKQFHKDQDS